MLALDKKNLILSMLVENLSFVILSYVTVQPSKTLNSEKEINLFAFM